MTIILVAQWILSNKKYSFKFLIVTPYKKMNVNEFLNSEYAEELTKIIKKQEPTATAEAIKKTLTVNHRQLEYNGYFRRNNKKDLLNNSCRELWEFVDACNPEINIKK